MAANINSNYYIMTSYGGWSPCIQGNNAHGLRPFAGSVLPNCVGYTTGRFNELLGLNACTYFGNTNAENFYTLGLSQGLSGGTVPVVGGVIVWKTSGTGHCAVIERVIDNDTVYTSESGWGYTTAPVVKNYTRRRGSDGNWGYNGIFQGIVYPPGPVPPQPIGGPSKYYMLFFDNGRINKW